jgi:hypothetical protein
MQEQKYGPPDLCYPEDLSDAGPGLLRRRHGKGEAIWLPWLPEWLYFRDGLPEHRELVRQLVEAAAPRVLRLTGTGPVEVSLRETGGKRMVHLVNYAGQRGSAYEEPPALSGLRLGLPSASGSARALVSGGEMTFGAPDEDGYAWIDLPPLGYFEAVLLEQEGA